MSARKRVDQVRGDAFLSDQLSPFDPEFQPRVSEVHCSSARLCSEEFTDKISLVFPFQKDGIWPERVGPEICCWNDGEPIGTDKVPIPIPIQVNLILGTILPYKWFCSGACAKRWVIDRPLLLFNSDEILRNIDIMMKKCFGYTKGVIDVAPKLETLKKYNGLYTVEEYRMVGGSIAFSIHENNFVSNTMIIDAAKVNHASQVAIIHHMPRLIDENGHLDTTGKGTGHQWRIIGLQPPEKDVKSSLNASAKLYQKRGLYEEYQARVQAGTLSESDDEQPKKMAKIKAKGKGKKDKGSEKPGNPEVPKKKQGRPARQDTSNTASLTNFFQAFAKGEQEDDEEE